MENRHDITKISIDDFDIVDTNTVHEIEEGEIFAMTGYSEVDINKEVQAIEILALRRNGPIYRVEMLDNKNRSIVLGEYTEVTKNEALKLIDKILEKANERDVIVKYIGESMHGMFGYLPNEVQEKYNSVKDNDEIWLSEMSITMNSSYYDDGYYNGDRYEFTNTKTGQSFTYDRCLNIGEQHNTGLRNVLKNIGISEDQITNFRDNYNGFFSNEIYKADLYYDYNKTKTNLIKNLSEKNFIIHEKVTDSVILKTEKVIIEKEEIRNYYDLTEIKNIPLESIASIYNKSIAQRNGALWVNVRGEKTPSCRLYNETNTFCDFGNGRFGGDSVNFIAYCEGVEHKLSDEERYVYIEKLAQHFGVQPQNLNPKQPTEIELTLEQWKRIGIQGDMASKNIDFDFEKYSEKQNMKFAEHYRVSMNELIKKDEKGYYQILKKRALPFLYEKRNDYYYQCFLEDKLSISNGQVSFENKEVIEMLISQKKDLELSEKALSYAIKDENKLPYKYVEYDVKTDIEKIRKGEISFQVGNVDYLSLKQFENTQGHNLIFNTVTYEQYSFLRRYDLDELPHSAFVKGNKVNVCYTQNDELVISKLIQEVTNIKDLDIERTRRTLVEAEEKILLAKQGAIPNPHEYLSKPFLESVEIMRNKVTQHNSHNLRKKL
jgi:hypothetical protein